MNSRSSTHSFSSVDFSQQISSQANTEVGRGIIHLVGAEPDVAAVLADETKLVISFKKRGRKWYNFAGNGVSFCFAVGCGVTAAAALATLVTGPLFYVFAAILCFSTTYANYHMTRHDVSNIFVGGIKGLFQKESIVEAEVDIDTLEAPRHYLPPVKIALLSGGILLSLSFGVVFGALTYGSTLALVSAFTFLSAVSVALPPVGIILGVLTFICLSTLMIKAFSDLIKTENLKDKVVSKIKNIFATSEKDAGKKPAYLFMKKLLIGLTATALVVGVFGLVIWGQISTLANCASEFGKILTTISGASMAAVDIASKVIGIGCGLAAQIPFILKTSVQPIIKLFAPSKKIPKAVKTTTGEVIKSILLVTTSLFSAVATSTIALKDKGLEVFSVFAGVGAFLNNFLGTVINATISQPLPVEPKSSHSQRTATLRPKTLSTTAQLSANFDFVFDRSPYKNVIDDYFTEEGGASRNLPSPTETHKFDAAPPAETISYTPRV